MAALGQLFVCMFAHSDPKDSISLQLCDQVVNRPFDSWVLGMCVSLPPEFKVPSNHYPFEDLDLKEEIWYFLVTPTLGDVPGLYLHPLLLSSVQT